MINDIQSLGILPALRNLAEEEEFIAPGFFLSQRTAHWQREG